MSQKTDLSEIKQAILELNRLTTHEPPINPHDTAPPTVPSTEGGATSLSTTPTGQPQRFASVETAPSDRGLSEDHRIDLNIDHGEGKFHHAHKDEIAIHFVPQWFFDRIPRRQQTGKTSTGAKSDPCWKSIKIRGIEITFFRE